MVAFFQKITDVLNESNIPYMLSGSVAMSIYIIPRATLRQEEFNRRKKVDFFDKTIYIVSPEDLLISKLIWIQDFQSSQQMEDIRNLAVIEHLDWPYIKKWINRLKLKSFNLLNNE